MPLLIPGEASAQVLDDGSKARINLAAKLRMLSQRGGSVACRMAAEIDDGEVEQMMRDILLEVPSILAALKEGNPQLGIPTVERHSRVLLAIESVRKDWERMATAMQAMLNGDADAFATVEQQATEMLDSAVILASEVSATYSNPNEILFVDAMAIELAGRQRVLTQSMALEACELGTGTADAEIRATLQETMGLFERTLTALRDGFEAVGVRPPSNETVATKISTAWDVWDGNKARLVSMMNDPQVSEISPIAADADALMRHMNDLVILYILSTPGRDDAIRSVLRTIGETQLAEWARDAELIAAVKAQNVEHAELNQMQIDSLDQRWRKEEGEGGGEMIDGVLSRPVSQTLRDKQVATAGFINEIFVMDNKGLNVAQSAVTSDYWQGDEEKWQDVYGNGSGEVHVSEVEFDDSSGVFQSQVSIPVRDENGELIGAITFGVNVQTLL